MPSSGWEVPRSGSLFTVDTTAGGYVRGGPMATPSLEFVDGSDIYSCTAWFILVNQTRMATGRAVITADLWVDEVGGTAVPLRVDIRQANPSVFTFVTVEFRSDGVGAALRRRRPGGECGDLRDRRHPVPADRHRPGRAHVRFPTRRIRPRRRRALHRRRRGSGADPLRHRSRLGPDRPFLPRQPPGGRSRPVAVQPLTWGRLRQMFAP